MMAKGHFLSGVTGGLLSSPLAVALAPAGVETPARALALAGAYTALVGIGSLWPDIDHKLAFISRCLWIVSRFACWIMRQVSLAVFEATCTEKDKRGLGHPHRTFTHTLPFPMLTGAGTAALLLATPAHAWAAFVGFALGLGTLVHILGDAMTLSGVPVRWPLLDSKGRRWSTWGFRWFRAGGPVGERIATLVFTGLAGGLGCLVLLANGSPWWLPVLGLLEGR